MTRPTLSDVAAPAVRQGLLTLPEAAAYLGLTVPGLKYRVYNLRAVSSVRFGRCIRFRREDLDAYIAAHTVPAQEENP